MKEVSLAAFGKPKWDGEPLSWRTFIPEWNAYWDLNGRLMGATAKKWVFIGCLPPRYQEHMKAYVTQNGWSFENVYDFICAQVQVLLPDWKLIDEWRKCLPKGKDYMEFMHWYLTWSRLGMQIPIIQPHEWNFQFDRAMAHQGHFSKYLKEIFAKEMESNKRWDLAERVHHVKNRLQVEYLTSQTLDEHVKSVSAHTPQRIVCKNCGRQGHHTNDCRSRSRTMPISPRRKTSFTSTYRGQPHRSRSRSQVSQKTILHPGDGTPNALNVKIDIPATFLNMSLNKGKRMACA